MKKSFFFAAMAAGFILSGCVEEKLTETKSTSESQVLVTADGNYVVDLPEVYDAPLTAIPVLNNSGEENTLIGAASFTVYGITEDANLLTFTTNKKISGKTVLDASNYEVVDETYVGNTLSIQFSQDDVVDNTLTFLIPLPAGEYDQYSLYIENKDGLIDYGFTSGEDNAFVVKPGQISVLEDGSSFCADTKAIGDKPAANSTDCQRPWEKAFATLSGTDNTLLATGKPAFKLGDNRYSVSQYLGKYSISGQSYSDIMQGFHVMRYGTYHDGNILFTQTHRVLSTTGAVRKRNLRLIQVYPSVYTSKVAAQTNTNYTEKNYNSMELEWFGHGQDPCVEEVGNSLYIWMSCHGQINEENTECASSQTIARFKWAGSQGNLNTEKDVPLVTRESIAEKDLYMYKVNTDTKGHPSTLNMTCTIWDCNTDDTSDDIFAIQYRVNSTSRRYYKIYKLNDVKKAPIEDARVWKADLKKANDAKIKGTDDVPIRARNIARLTPIAEAEFLDSELPFLTKYGDTEETSLLACQGFDVLKINDSKFRIYALFGEAHNTTAKVSRSASRGVTVAYIATKEIISKAPQAAQYSRITCFDNHGEQLQPYFYTSKRYSQPYYEVEGIKLARNFAKTCQGEKVYIGFATGAGDGLNNYANVIKFSRYSRKSE